MSAATVVTVLDLGERPPSYRKEREMTTILDDALVGDATAPRNRWLNYLGDNPAEDAVRAACGPGYDRLREAERRYDPDNVFHLNHNIRIGEG